MGDDDALRRMIFEALAAATLAVASVVLGLATSGGGKRRDGVDTTGVCPAASEVGTRKHVNEKWSHDG